jgi:hypothetical protein
MQHPRGPESEVNTMKKIIKNIIISAMFYSAGFMLAAIGPYVI